jgi:hypothetical protein
VCVGRNMGIKTIKYVLFVAIPLLAVVNLVKAEEPAQDKFRLSVGGYFLTRYNSTISMQDPDLGAGISISPQDTLGIDIENTVLRVEGYYRYSPKHALTYSWYSINSTGLKTIEKEFIWRDPDGTEIVIPVGAQVSSVLEYDIFKLGYLWSFYHSDKVEMGVGAGLHITRVGLGLNSNLAAPPTHKVTSVTTTVPLPVFSFVLKYRVTPEFLWYLKTEAFYLKFDNYAGSYRDTTLGMEYRAWKHVALGAGLSSNSLEIEEEDPNFNLKFNSSISGALLYVATYF